MSTFVWLKSLITRYQHCTGILCVVMHCVQLFLVLLLEASLVLCLTEYPLVKSRVSVLASDL